MSMAKELAGMADLAARGRAIELRARLKDKDSSKKGLSEISYQVEKMSKEKPDDADLLAALGLLALKEKDFARAKDCFNKALALDAGKQEALLGLARLAKEEANPSLAREMLTKLSQLAPGDSEAKDLSDALK
ncbi:MAG: cellulose synthase subunit BcsC [bacterium ADurb.Bin425]|nr:MAG: cellulose synthase subunit BcsC [bacterium ADurb.Bin425]